MSAQSGYPDDQPGDDRPDAGHEPGDDGIEWSADRAIGTDDWIADRAVVALRRDPLVTGRGLEIMVQNRVVILVGDVDSPQERMAAARRAWTVPGVYDVANCVTVSGHVAGVDGGY